ncbi:hypothetical protein NYE67_03360 [Solibacillus sp. FSL W8-0474]|uniref:hypothetical protein n=1 Tax=Solibacillus sp. FSL W8-0474 TaxID=2975336 RepID=UPI0030F80C0F
MISEDWPLQDYYQNKKREKFLTNFPIEFWSKVTTSRALRIFNPLRVEIKTDPDSNSNESAQSFGKTNQFKDLKEGLIILFNFSQHFQHEKSKEEIKLLATLLVNEYFDVDEKVNIQHLLEELSVINNELITEIVQIVLCNIKIEALPQQKKYLSVRRACIEYLSNHLNDSIEFFINIQTPASLLSAMLLHFEGQDSKNRSEIWEVYLRVVENNEFFWSYNLQKNLDDYQFLWLTAGILAQQKLPLDSFKLAVNRIKQPTEGWGVQNKELYKMDKRIVHLYTVGTMASEWLLAQERKEEAVQLYNYVFHKTTNYLRKSIPYKNDYINLLITELWARLPLIKPSDYIDITLYTIPLYDEYKHILLALTELYKNSHNKMSVRLIMREIHEELFPVEKLIYAHDENILNWYEQFNWWEE